jgi:hypothetical protein
LETCNSKIKELKEEIFNIRSGDSKSESSSSKIDEKKSSVSKKDGKDNDSDNNSGSGGITSTGSNDPGSSSSQGYSGNFRTLIYNFFKSIINEVLDFIDYLSTM